MPASTPRTARRQMTRRRFLVAAAVVAPAPALAACGSQPAHPASADGSGGVARPGVASAAGAGSAAAARGGSAAPPAPRRQVSARISPPAGVTVGVGQPIAVELSYPVRDHASRAQVERLLRVAAAPATTGAWHWFDATHLSWRPREFWTPGARVRLDAHLSELALGDDARGAADQQVTFTIGDAVITTVDAAKDTLTLTRNGAPLRVIPITAGRTGFATRNGVKVILGRERQVVMDSRTIGVRPGSPNAYHLDVSWAVRVTWSGEYLHAAPWSVRSQGRANVSHGCVGMSTADARWYYGQVRLGDVVRVVNSQGRRMEPYGNGYGDWNLSWPQWLAGSELGAALTPT